MWRLRRRIIIDGLGPSGFLFFLSLSLFSFLFSFFFSFAFGLIEFSCSVYVMRFSCLARKKFIDGYVTLGIARMDIEQRECFSQLPPLSLLHI